MGFLELRFGIAGSETKIRSDVRIAEQSDFTNVVATGSPQGESVRCADL